MPGAGYQFGCWLLLRARAAPRAAVALWALCAVLLCAAGWVNAQDAGATPPAPATPPPPTPRWHISYRRAPGLVVPAMIADWWRAARQRDALRWRPLTGWAGDPGAWLDRVHSASLTVVQRAPAGWPTSLDALSGSVDGGGIASSTATLLGAWPRRVVAVRADGIAVRDPGMPAETVQEPSGWHITCDQATIRCYYRSFPLPLRLHVPFIGFALMPIWTSCLDQVDITVSEPTVAHWRTGRAELVKPLDARRLALLPDGLAFSCALGINGAAVAATYARVEPEFEPDAQHRRTTYVHHLAELARAIDGTVLIGMETSGDIVINVPRTALFDAAIAHDVERWMVLEDGQPMEWRHSGMSVLRTGDSWSFSSSLAALDAWRAPPRQAATAPSGAWCVATMKAELMASMVEQLCAHRGDLTGGVVGTTWNFGSNVWPLQPEQRRRIALIMGGTLMRPAVDTAALAIAVRAAGDTSMVGVVDQGALRLDVNGAVATWLPVAAALRAARDELFHDCAMRRLGEVLARLQSAGIGPDSLALSRGRTAPAGPAARALSGRLVALGQLTSQEWTSPAYEDWHEHGRITPAHRDAAIQALADGDLLATSAVLDDPALPSLSAFERLQDVGRPAMTINGNRISISGLGWPMEVLRANGLNLVAAGDLRGFTLIARADRMLCSTRAALLAGPMGRHGTIYDKAVFLAADQGFLDPREATAMLACQPCADNDTRIAPWPAWFASARALDRDRTHDASQRHFTDVEEPLDLAAALETTCGLRTPAAVPVMIGYTHQYWFGDAMLDEPLVDLRPWLAHSLIRRGLALMLLARAGRLPADDRGVAAATGPLEASIGGFTVRVRVARYRDGGFRLTNEIDDPADPTAGEEGLSPFDWTIEDDACAQKHFVTTPRSMAWHPLGPSP